VTGLRNNHEYRFVVRAHNAAGAGKHTRVHTVTPQPPASKPAPPPTPTPTPTPTPIPTQPVEPTQPAPVLRAPGAPVVSEISYDADVAGLVVPFQAPEDSGSSAITGYQYSLDGGVWTDFAYYAANGDLYNADPILADNSHHTVAVRAVNAAGDGVSSNVRSYDPPAAQSALELYDVYPSGTWLVFSQPSGPFDDIEYTADGGLTWQSVPNLWCDTEPDSYCDNEDPIVMPTGRHTYMVRTVLNGVAGPESNAIDAITPDATPVLNSVGNEPDPYWEYFYFDLEFDSPYTVAGEPVDHYEYQYSTDGGTTWSAWATIDNPTVNGSSVTGQGLSPYTYDNVCGPAMNFQVRVAAVNADGDHSLSNPLPDTMNYCD
jgi:hypothetical protein